MVVNRNILRLFCTMLILIGFFFYFTRIRISEEDMLHYSLIGRTKGVVRNLEQGVDIKYENEDGNDVLLLATQNNNNELVNILTHQNIDINRVNKNGYSALHYSVMNGNKELINLFMEKGAKTNIKTKDNKTPFMLAVENGSLDIVMLFDNYGDYINSSDIEGNTPLIIAVQHGDLSLTKYLLDKGANVNIKNIDGKSSLYTAVELGFIDIVKVLIDKGADVNEGYFENNFTPLMLACSNGNYEIVESLLEAGANTEEHNISLGTTPLLYTILQDNRDSDKLVKTLLEYNADVNAVDLEGFNPLLASIQSQKINVVKTLVEEDIDLNKYIEIKSDGEEYLTTYFIEACGFNDLNIIKLLVSYGADINLKRSSGFTALHIASQREQEDVIDYLLEIYPNVNLISQNGFTPLHISAYVGNKSISKKLIKSGANPNISMSESSVLDLAIKGDASQELIDYLKSIGAK